jgi:hypothetical protein
MFCHFPSLPLNPVISERREVLTCFPFSVQRSIITSVVTSIHDQRESIILTKKQLLWNLEIIGQGLLLQLEDINIITKCIEVLESWTVGLWLSAPTIPSPLLENPSFFIIIIFDQITKVFIPRVFGELSKYHYLIIQHCALCAKAVTLIQENTRRINSRISYKTWKKMLIIMMSITDLFFSQANSLADTVYDKMRKETLKFMSKYLNNLVLRALFEMWVASCSHCFPDPTLWKTLFFHAQFWRHESAFVPQWSFLSISLTHRLLSILYGKATGAPNLVLDGPTDSSLIELQVKALEPFIIEDFNIQCFVHCWFRMLMLIGNPCELELSICFLQAMQAVSSIILSFIDVSEPPEEEQATLKDFIYQSLARYLTGKYYPPFMPSDDSFIIKEKKLQKRNNYLKPPCGNSILNLFGEWLVEAAYSPFHQGRAQAIGILCRIFSSSKQDARPFLLTYLARFYIAVTDALESGDGMVTTLVIMNSERLFLNKLQGMKLLVVPFLVALEKTLTSKEPSYQVPYFVTLEKLRRTAIQVRIFYDSPVAAAVTVCIRYCYLSFSIPTIIKSYMR